MRKYIGNPLNKGHKLNEHKTLRRRLGRLPNVFSMFTLRPVHRGLPMYSQIWFVNDNILSR